MPSDSTSIPSSEKEQSMPCDGTPRSFAFLILKSPGSTAPTVATVTVRPRRQLDAPHTMSATALLRRYQFFVTCSLSASGCWPHLNHFAYFNVTEFTSNRFYIVNFQTSHSDLRASSSLVNCRFNPPRVAKIHWISCFDCPGLLELFKETKVVLEERTKGHLRRNEASLDALHPYRMQTREPCGRCQQSEVR